MEIIKADTIEQYNRFFGFQTRHPLVDVVHFNRSGSQPEHKMTFGFYALFLKKTVGCTINYGKTKYDYDDETVVCFAPGQTVGVQPIEDGPVPEADALLFHPDFLLRTPLAQKIKQYTFFSYASNEALHLSADERMIVQVCDPRSIEQRCAYAFRAIIGRILGRGDSPSGRIANGEVFCRQDMPFSQLFR